VRLKSILDSVEELLEGHARYLARESVLSRISRIESVDARYFDVRITAEQQEQAYRFELAYIRREFAERLARLVTDCDQEIIPTLEKDPDYYG
jgi:hypothetical protein